MCNIVKSAFNKIVEKPFYDNESYTRVLNNFAKFLKDQYAIENNSSNTCNKDGFLNIYNKDRYKEILTNLEIETMKKARKDLFITTILLVVITVASIFFTLTIASMLYGVTASFSILIWKFDKLSLSLSSIPSLILLALFFIFAIKSIIKGFCNPKILEKIQNKTGLSIISTGDNKTGFYFKKFQRIFELGLKDRLIKRFKKRLIKGKLDKEITGKKYNFKTLQILASKLHDVKAKKIKSFIEDKNFDLSCLGKKTKNGNLILSL